MVLTLKHKIRYYRKFGVDIWGLSKLSLAKSRTSTKQFKHVFRIFSKKSKARLLRLKETQRRYIYQVDVERPLKPRKFLKKRFASLRLVKLFFLTLTYKQFNKMARRARTKDGFFGDHFLCALEGRLISLLYRTSFVSNMFESLFYIKNSFVTLNRKVVSYTNSVASLFAIISFHPLIKKKSIVIL